MTTSSLRLPRAGLLACALLSAGAPRLPAADVSLIVVVKGQNLSQNNPVAPRLGESDPLALYASVGLSASNSVTSAQLRRPTGQVVPLLNPGSPDELSIDEGYESMAMLEATNPNGFYQVTIQTAHEGPRQVNVELTGDAWPNVPYVTNYTAAQSIIPTSDFSLFWAPFIGGTTNDLVLVEVWSENNDETVYVTPGPGEPGALDGTDTSVRLSAGLLASGQVYRASITFAKITQVNTNDYPGVLALAGYYSSTEVRLTTVGAPMDPPPGLQFCSPSFGEPGVPLNSVLAFRFNKAMQTGISIQWGGAAQATNMTTTWSFDRRTLYCVPRQPYPPSSEVAWSLNTPGFPQNFRDQAGNLLPPIAGTFQTGAGPAPTTDLRSCFLIRARKFVQTNATAVLTGNHLFGLYSDLLCYNAITNGTVLLPDGRLIRPEPDGDGDNYDWEAAYAREEELLRFFPNGTYTVMLGTVHNGTNTVALPLSSATFPNAPTVTNLAAGLLLNASQDFTLKWTPFAGGTANDFVVLDINNDLGQRVFSVGEPGTSPTLDGRASEVTLPGGTLSPGRAYTGQLLFAKTLAKDTTSYPGATAYAFTLSLNSFPLATGGEPIRPRLEMIPAGGQTYRIRVHGEDQRTYRVELKQELSQADWWPWFTGTAYGGTVDTPTLGVFMGPTAFYRAVEVQP